MAEKSVAQKLQIKPGRRVAFVNPPEGYHQALGEVPEGAVVLDSPDEGGVDVLQVFVADRAELEARLPRLKEALAPGGMLWVTYYKGSARVKTDIHRDSINAYAATLGMQGVAMISVDADWSALRLKVVGGAPQDGIEAIRRCICAFSRRRGRRRCKQRRDQSG